MSQGQAIDWLKLGVAAARSGDRVKARQTLEQAIRLDPKSELAWFWYAGVLDDAEETLEALGYVLEINPRNEKALAAQRKARLQVAINDIRKGNKDRGRRMLLDLCREDSNCELGWLWLSGTTENPEEALEYLNHALEINPDNERAKAGIEYYRERMESRAAWQCPVCQETAAVKQHTCPACGTILALVDVDSMLGNGGADEEMIRTGITRLLGKARVKPDFTTHCYVGIAYLNLNKLTEAINQFQVALRLQDHEPLRLQLDMLQRRRAERERDTRKGKSDSDTPPRRVLVVDDSATLRKIVVIVGEKNGVNVSEAIDGDEALEKLQQDGPPDLILVESDGKSFDLCRVIRRDPAARKLPVVVLSDRDGWLSRIRRRMAGASGAMEKPFHPDRLVELFRDYRLLPEPAQA